MATTTRTAPLDLGEHALTGWRKRLADTTAPRLAKRTPLSERHIRGALGLLFVALAVRHLALTVKGFVQERRRS
jgi:hypothetical protein